MSKNKNNRDPLEVIGRAKGYSHEQLIINLPRHSQFSNVLLDQIKQIPEVVLRNSGTPMAKKVNRMMREVFSEVYRAKQFIRTEISNRGVLFGAVLLKHRVIDLVLEYFHKRWSQCIICLYNEYNHKTTIIDEKGKIREFDDPLKKVVEIVSINRPVIPYFDEIQFSGEDIFETLYSSQFISERKNMRYFKRMIPNKCFKLPGMRNGAEKRFQNENLNKFL